MKQHRRFVKHGVAENVKMLAAKPDASMDTGKDVLSQLEVCLEDLAEAGFGSRAILCSPHEFWLPEVRWRSLIVFTSVLDGDELQAVINDFEALKGGDWWPLEMFCLSDDDPYA